ncbi:MAG: hypothetical protein AB1397_08050 [bacterium]
MKNVEKLQNTHYNIGTGIDYSIKELAIIIAKIVEFEGRILWDRSKPMCVKKTVGQFKIFRLRMEASNFHEGWTKKDL